MGKRVLIVDDEPDIRLVVRVWASTMGHDVVAEAADGREAIELARQHQPDAIVLDVMMPGMTGLEALPGIREVCPGATVVIFSVLGPEEGALDLADHWVQKGDSLDALGGAFS